MENKKDVIGRGVKDPICFFPDECFVDTDQGSYFIGLDLTRNARDNIEFFDQMCLYAKYNNIIPRQIGKSISLKSITESILSYDTPLFGSVGNLVNDMLNETPTEKFNSHKKLISYRIFMTSTSRSFIKRGCGV